MGPTNNLGYLIQHLAAVMSKQTDKVLQEQLGIGLSQFRILMVLEWNPRVQQSTIATSLGQTEASISRQIKLLEKRGFLVTKPDPLNKRKHIATPTPIGNQITEAATAVIRRNLGPEFASMGEEELVTLIGGLQELHRIVCRPGKAGACNHPMGL
jgi:DNA-binding MarR family transcriptional regulator